MIKNVIHLHNPYKNTILNAMEMMKLNIGKRFKRLYLSEYIAFTSFAMVSKQFIIFIHVHFFQMVCEVCVGFVYMLVPTLK